MSVWSCAYSDGVAHKHHGMKLSAKVSCSEQLLTGTPGPPGAVGK